MSRINVMQPFLGAEEIAAVTEVISSGWVAQGPRVAAFETAFAAHQQADHAVAVSSCTTALHLALIVAGVEAGDDVVVPSFSFIATANAAVYVGARPVFADVDLQTGTLTAETVAAALTPNTTAVIAVDQGGVPVDLDAIRAICDPRGIVVVQDAACGAGSTYKGRPVGAGAEIAAWSFHPRKIITTGEGGMITTSRADWAERARRLREHAMSVSAADRHASVLAPPEQYLEVGYNFRMTDLQAAVGLVQLDRLDGVVQRRREIAAGYAKAVDRAAGLRLVADPAWGTTNFQSCWLEVGPGLRLGPGRPAHCTRRSRHLRAPRHYGLPPATCLRGPGYRRPAATGDRAPHRQHADPAAVPSDVRVRTGPGHRLCCGRVPRRTER